MRVLLVHNYYKQRGGEDESFEAEGKMLEDFGHEVKRYTRHNDDIDNLSRLSVAAKTFWNRRSYRELKVEISAFQPEIIHCTNLFPLLSASVYGAANQANVPLVQSLRNYRLMCLNSFFYRENSICEKCKTRTIALPGVMHGCYRGSRLASTIVAAHNSYHRVMKTWQRKVDRFFTPTEFARQQYVESGFPAEKISVKPNFLAEDPGVATGDRSFGLFVGRLSIEKGIKTLIEAWKKLSPSHELKIVGGGELESYVQEVANQNENITYCGLQPLAQVKQLMGQARFLVMPSEWYETFGRTIMESYSRGTPVIASRLGAMSEVVENGNTGIHFTPGHVEELVVAIKRLINDESERAEMGRCARATFERKYTAAANHEILTGIYKKTIQERGG